MHKLFAVFVWCSQCSRCVVKTYFFLQSLVEQVLFTCQCMNFFGVFSVFKSGNHPFLVAVLIRCLSAHLLYLSAPTELACEETLQRLLREVAGTFSFLTVRFSIDHLYSLSREKMSQCFAQSLFPMTLYRQLYQGFLNTRALKLVKRMCIQSAAITFFLNHAHRRCLSRRYFRLKRCLCHGR